MKRLLWLTVVVLLLLSGCNAPSETIPVFETDAEPDKSEINAIYPSLGGVPTLYIDTVCALDSVTKEEYVNASFTLSESETVEVTASIKGRGNASWGLPQRPYNIKLEEPADLLGMGEAKSWVIITLYYDKTLLRNYLTLNLDKTVSGDHAMSCRFANVVFNGEYNGLYLLTEKIQDNKNRVDLDKKEGDILFEIEESFRHEYVCDDCIFLRSGTHLTFKDPERDDLTAGEMKKLQNEMSELFTPVDKAIRDKAFDVYSKLIDVDSFVNWYIVNEFVKNYDSKFVTSCYCYVKDGIVYMGPSWDFDTCMGNQDVETCMHPKGFHVSQAPWYRSLLKSDEFVARLHERWQELRAEGVFNAFIASIDTQTAYLSQASAMQFDRWRTSLAEHSLRGNKSLYTYAEELEYLKNWLTERIEWLDGEWGQ